MSKENKQAVNKDPLANIWVDVKFKCPICGVIHYKHLQQSKLRRWPRYVEFKGKKIPTRQPDGTLLMACPNCVDKVTANIERARRKKTSIITDF